MKTNLLSKLIFGIMIFSLAISSCSRSINGIQIVREKKIKTSESNSSGITKKEINPTKNETEFDSNRIAQQKNNDETLTASSEKTNSDIINPTAPSITNNNSGNFKIDWSGNNLEECDVIVLKTGEEVNAKVTEVGQEEIKYKKCENLSGPTYSINKSEVFMIKYSNGTKDIISPSNSTTQNSTAPNNGNSKNKTEKSGSEFAGLISFIFGIVGLIVLPIPFGIVAMILGAIGINKKLKGFAITGLILGFIDVVIGLILLALALSYY